MVINLLIFLVLLALTLGAGWLTWKAVRAKRLWVKIAGGLGASLLTLVLAAVTYAGGKGVAMLYFPSAPATPELAAAATPEQIARGEYLVNIACAGCHAAPGPDGRPTRQLPLSGGWDLTGVEGFGFIGQMTPENLTPGGKLADYSDGEMFRALRHGVSRDGRALAMMSLMPFRQLSDADTEAIIAYLRSLPPVATTLPTGDNINFIGAAMVGAGMFGPIPEPDLRVLTAPAEGLTAEYGEYVATYGECRGCHGPDMTGTPATSISAEIPNPRPLVSELTLEQFVEMMRSGVRPGNNPFPETMPWENASKMTDNDLAALYAYLIAPVN